MKQKLFNILAVLTSLVGYLEWGGGQSSFLFQAESEFLLKLFSDPVSAAHPFTLVPLLGQMLLIVTLFQKEPSSRLTYIGLACIGLLLLFIFLIGLFSFEWKILLSTVPFLAASAFAIMEARKI